MDTQLADWDLDLNSTGLPYEVYGENEIKQQIRIRLKTPKGKFVYDKSLGSRLKELAYEGAESRSLGSKGKLLVREALADMPGLRFTKLDVYSFANHLVQVVYTVIYKGKEITGGVVIT